MNSLQVESLLDSNSSSQKDMGLFLIYSATERVISVLCTTGANQPLETHQSIDYRVIDLSHASVTRTFYFLRNEMLINDHEILFYTIRSNHDKNLVLMSRNAIVCLYFDKNIIKISWSVEVGNPQ